MMLLSLCTLAYSLFWLGLCPYLIHHSRTIPFLTDMVPQPPIQEPSLTIVIPVRNEEKDLEQALQSLLHIHYQNYQLVLVNDRSTDQTPRILEAIRAHYQQVLVLTLTDLPKGWLGKNYAAYYGSQQATTEWLLFTDADVLFSADSIRKALYFAQTHQLDHLAILPKVSTQSSLLDGVLSLFKIALDLRQKPWQAQNPHSDSSMGVGAFNLVRRSAYHASGTHQAIKLRPDDDLRLGQQLKKAGFRQAVLYGDPAIQLQWYSRLGDFINGLMKNSFAALDYQVGKVVLSVVGLLSVFVLPLPLLLVFGAAWMRVAVVLVLGVQIYLYRHKPGLVAPWWHALLIPFSGGVLVFILAKSCYLTLRQQGIVWRETFYSLTELRTNR